MKVTTVSANVRYSRPLGDGSYKTVELGAEASLSGQESWDKAQAELYEQLGSQLKALWNCKNGGNGSETTTQEHFCLNHNTAFQRYEKGGRVWYAHKAGSEWCNEKKTA